MKATPLRLPKDPTKNVWHWHYGYQEVSITENSVLEVDGQPLEAIQDNETLRANPVAEMADFNKIASQAQKTSSQLTPPHGGLQ